MALATFACLWTQRPAMYELALALCVLATITDWFDGYIARVTKSESPFGAMADPIADKVLVIGALIAFVRSKDVDIPNWPVFLIIVRELLVGGLRALAGIQGKTFAAGRWGKWSMGIQSGAIIAILILLVAKSRGCPLPAALDDAPYGLAVLCMAVSLLSGGQYAYKTRGMLRKSWNPPGG